MRVTSDSVYGKGPISEPGLNLIVFWHVYNVAFRLSCWSLVQVIIQYYVKVICHRLTCSVRFT